MKTNIFSQKFINIAVVVIIIVGIILRLQNFHLQPIDGHAMRQTDTESVAYNFSFENHNMLYPHNSFIRPITNTDSYFFLEFPAYQYLIGIFYMLFGWHIELARIVNIGLFITAAGCLYYFVKQYFSKDISLFTIAFFVFSPASIFFVGHAIHPDVFMITTTCISLASYIKWKKSKSIIFFIIACLTLSLSVSTRPFSLIILPAYLFMLWDLKANYWEYPVIAASSIVLYGFWYYWTKRFKDIADHSWENWVLGGRKEVFTRDVFFHSLIMKNIVGEVIGKFASLLAAIGILSFFLKRNRKYLFIFAWLIGVPAYWYIAPYGNLFHQYYADVYLLPIIMAAGIGATIILSYIKKIVPIIIYPVALLIIVFAFYNGYRTSSYYFNDKIPDFDLRITEDIQNNIPKDKKLLFYQVLNPVPFSIIHRKGWVLGALPVDVEPSASAILSLRQYGLNYIVESQRAPLITPEVHKDIDAYITLVYKSKWSTIYKVK